MTQPVTYTQTWYYSADEVAQALKPIASLIGKSEKSQQKPMPGTWQHTLLHHNLKALHIASAVMYKTNKVTNKFTQSDLEAATGALVLMIRKSTEAQAKFTPGVSRHTLLHNRLKALRIAQALIHAKLEQL